MNLDDGLAPVPWRSALLATLPGVVHALTGRVAGMGRADGNVAFSAPRDRADAWEMRQRWCASAALSPHRLVTLGQVHGAAVHLATAAQAGCGAMPGATHIGFGDALICNEAGPVLMTLHADCQPILFIDPARGSRGAAVGVAHAGWRGTVADVAGQTLAAMAEAFGTRAEDVQVCLGPAIGPCCYEVGGEVEAAWRACAGSDADGALGSRDGRRTFSLRDANALLLARHGVRGDHVEMTTVCTRCQGVHWFSHRGQGAATGRFGAMIAIAEDRFNRGVADW